MEVEVRMVEVVEDGVGNRTISLKKDNHNIVYSDNCIVYIPYIAIKKRIIPLEFNQRFLDICHFFNTFLIDRTGDINSNICILESIPSDYNLIYNFDEICKISAKEIVSKALLDEVKIHLLWSGGIDSTTALIAIYKELKNVNKTECLKILLSKESIDEFENFFTNFIKKNIDYEVFTPPIFTSLDKDNLSITGELGDQIFGGNMVYDYMDRDDIFDNWREPFLDILYKKFKDIKKVDNCVGFTEPFMRRAPFELKSLYDLLWWFSFASKWQVVQYTLISQTYQEGELQFKLGDNIIHFFNHIEFQKWAIQNRINQTRYDVYNYKFQAKEYIYNFFPDKDYLLKKQKEKSLKKIISGNSAFSFL